jgi:hypothetical protein
MLLFLDNLMKNPSRHSIEELYNFLVHRHLPITETGCFLAYKAVRMDYKDWYSNSVDNSIGQEPFMERNEVDDDWRVECSSGYHVGAIEYVDSYSKGFSDPSRIMIVEVNPMDVVSAPSNENFTKCRVCKYRVIGEMQGELLEHVYRTTRTSFEPSPRPQPEPANSMCGQYSSDDNDGDWDTVN